jgi:putative secretion ATPase (PEP-CTERM system associated)
MYERYFQLRERPFALSPDPEYLYPSRVHQEALSYLRYGIEGHAGFVVITGEIGSGKTTMLQSLLGRLDRNTAVARIVNTMFDARELLEAIVLDFGMDPTGLSKPVLLHRLGQFLVQQRQANRLTLLVIDEAQNLSLPALEEIRMLSNLETEKSKLIQIILIGQPDLRDKLALPQLEQLRQRITVSYHLQPLDAGETHNYINHRLRRAAIGTPVEFPQDVTAVIHARSRGVPRIINVIADATLLFSYGVDRRDIDAGIVREALEELDATGVLASYHAEGGHPEAAPPPPSAAPPSAAQPSAAQPSATQPAAAQPATAAPALAAAAAREAEEARKRDDALKQREQQIAAREQAIAAQQKVVEEEARLLASARSVGASGAASASGAVSASGAPVARVATVAPRAPLAPVPLAPSTPYASTAPGAPYTPYVTPSGVRVQRYQPTAYVRPQARYGMWERLRRVLFGVTEPW